MDVLVKYNMVIYLLSKCPNMANFLLVASERLTLWTVSPLKLVLAIFYSVNMLVLGLAVKYLHRSLSWLYSQDTQITDLYATAAAIVVLVNCSSFIVCVAITG